MTDGDLRNRALAAVAYKVRVCRQCDLHKTRARTVPGQGMADAEVVFIGEAPGETEDREGLPFVGRSGQFLKKMLRETGGDGRWCFITNAVKCRPPNNRTPTRQELAACRPWLMGQLAVIQPAIIVCVGKAAAQVILGVRPTAKMKGVRGQWHLQENGILVRVIWHPSYIMQYGKDREGETRADLRSVWDKVVEISGGTACLSTGNK